MTVTRLLLIRHGATSATEEDRFSGSSGAELSDEGRWQAARLGERLASETLSAIYVSPLSRALDTARIIAERCGVEPAVRDGLREIGHGHWEGMKRGDVEARFAAEYASWEEDPFTFAPEGGRVRRRRPGARAARRARDRDDAPRRTGARSCPTRRRCGSC